MRDAFTHRVIYTSLNQPPVINIFRKFNAIKAISALCRSTQYIGGRLIALTYARSRYAVFYVNIKLIKG